MASSTINAPYLLKRRFNVSGNGTYNFALENSQHWVIFIVGVNNTDKGMIFINVSSSGSITTRKNPSDLQVTLTPTTNNLAIGNNVNAYIYGLALRFN